MPAEIFPTEPHKIVQPRAHKAKICIWADLTVNDLDILNEARTPDEIKRFLCEIFHIEQEDKSTKIEILLDLYYYTIQFARDNHFNKEQTSTFFSIVKKCHEVCTETPFGNVDQCFEFFKDTVLCHAAKRPPHSMELFNAEEVRKVTEYVTDTYFRHYKLYKYVFTPLVRLDLAMNYIGLPVSPEPTEEESPAASELRALIQTHLADEIQKLKLSVEDQIKETDEIMNKKLSDFEGKPGSGKGGRASRGKKK